MSGLQPATVLEALANQGERLVEGRGQTKLDFQLGCHPKVIRLADQTGPLADLVQEGGDDAAVQDTGKALVVGRGVEDGGDLVRASLEELLLRHAVGEPVDRFGAVNEARGVMMIPIPRRGVYRGVRGVDDARRVEGIDGVTITAKPDVTLVPLPEGRSYLGFIFATAGTAAAAELALREAHRRMHFIIDREVTIAQ